MGQGVAALHADEGRVQPARARVVILAGAAHYARSGVGRFEQRRELAQVLEKRGLAVARVSEWIGGDDPGSTINGGVARARQVELTQQHAARKRGVPAP